MSYEEEHYEDYSQEYGQDAGQGYEGGVLSGGADGNKGYGRTLEELDAQINELMQKSSNEFGHSVWECLACGKIVTHKNDMTRHVESSHIEFPGASTEHWKDWTRK